MITNVLSNSEFKAIGKTDKSIKPTLRKATYGNLAVVDDRQIKFTFSTGSMDRDYDVIFQDGIDTTWFATNPVIFYGHDHESIPIARCVSMGIEGGNLTGVVEFAPADNPAVGVTADGIYQLCKGGFLNAVSIGFIATEWQYADDPARYGRDGVDVLKCELVEVSIVGIPSNRAALIAEIGTGTVIEPVEPVEIALAEEQKRYRAPRLRRILDSL